MKNSTNIPTSLLAKPESHCKTLEVSKEESDKHLFYRNKGAFKKAIMDFFLTGLIVISKNWGHFQLSISDGLIRKVLLCNYKKRMKFLIFVSFVISLLKM